MKTNDLYNAFEMPLSNNEDLREAQRKVLANIELNNKDKIILGRDKTVKQIGNYRLLEDHVYRLVDEETYREVYALAKNNLSNFEYTVFNYMVNNFSYNEIATILGKTPKQIDNAIQRIKTKMKDLMEKEGIIQ